MKNSRGASCLLTIHSSGRDMDQEQNEKVDDTRNRPLNLDTVPQDVALVLVSIIKSWSRKWYNQKSFNDRVKAEM